jgi:DNA-binding response OmpR family regulator
VLATGLVGVVVDAEPAIRQALERMLRYEGFAVRVASGGLEALAAIDAQMPAAVVLDVAMPDLDGVAVTRRLRARGIDVPICILSARDEVEDRVAGLRSGADDYLVKPFAPQELSARLHALLRRQRREDAQPIDFGGLRLDPRRHVAYRSGRELELTGREFELLLVLARHSGMVLTREQLLEQVWGYPAEVQTNVVDVFVGYVRRKLEAGGEPRILRTVRGVGFVLRP